MNDKTTSDKPGLLTMVVFSLAVGPVIPAACLVIGERLGRVGLSILLLPVAILEWVVGRGPNIGTAENPLYELTPVHELAGLAGLALSVLVYAGITFLILARASRTPGRRDRVNERLETYR